MAHTTMPDGKPKVLEIPGNALADPAFYDENPTDRRGPKSPDDGNLSRDGYPEPKQSVPFKIDGGG